MFILLSICGTFLLNIISEGGNLVAVCLISIRK